MSGVIGEERGREVGEEGQKRGGGGGRREGEGEGERGPPPVPDSLVRKACTYILFKLLLSNTAPSQFTKMSE